MNNKEALKRALKELIQAQINLDHGQKNGVPPEHMAALREKVEYRETVVEALRPMPHGEPLTLEQLREMDGKPVLVFPAKANGKIKQRWMLYAGVQIDTGMYLFAPTSGIAQGYKGSDYGKTWLAYAYQPAHIDREAWTAEWIKRGGYTECSKCDYWYDSPESEDDGDRPAFCPSCGRAMTPEAWAMLEKKLTGGG